MLFRKKSKSVAAPAPAAVSAAINGEPDLRGLGRVLWQKKTKILGFTLLAAAVAFVVVNAITPRYRSESRLLLETRENVFLRAEADKGVDRGTIDPEAVTSQIQLVLSRDLARDVINKEKLGDKPEFDTNLNGIPALRTLLGLLGIGRDPSAMSREERTMESYYDRLSVSAVEKSRVIMIDFSSADPELAARVANTVAETYLSVQQAVKQDQTRAAGNWLAGEIDKMRAKVADAEANVEEYRVKSNLFVGSNNSSLPNQQLTEINSQIAAARGQKADLEARARQLRDLVRSGKPVESSDIANSEFDATAGRPARRTALPTRRTIFDAARSASTHQGIESADRRARSSDLERGRTAGAPARQRCRGRRQPPGIAHGKHRPGQKTGLADQRAGRAVARARTRGQDPARPARILSGEIPRSLGT